MVDANKKSTAADEAGPHRLADSRFDPANRRQLSGPALRTFLAIADLWGLTESQRLSVLGHHARSTYQNWCRQARKHRDLTLDADVLTRMSAVFGIHQALEILFPTEELGIEWLRRPHKAMVFAGRPPLDLVTNGSQDGLLVVRRFLDGARGGRYMPPNALDEDFAPYSHEEIILR